MWKKSLNRQTECSANLKPHVKEICQPEYCVNLELFVHTKTIYPLAEYCVHLHYLWTAKQKS